MNTKIIFFDIDGTILSHRTHQISKTTKAALKQAKANGHLTFINTGRSFAELDETILEIGFDGYVCGCGTYITYQDKILLHTAISDELCRSIIKDLRNYKLEAVLEGSNAIYYDHQSTCSKIKKLQDIQKNGFHLNVLNWDAPDISIDKFCIWATSSESIMPFYEKYKDCLHFIKRDNLFFEIVPKGFSKATGIEYLLSHLAIPHENAYAFGDSVNDLEMLKYVKYSIGMGNSDEIIKNIVSFLTKDVDSDGISHALMHFSII